MSNALTINAKKAVNEIKDDLREICRVRSVVGFLIGLSGGIDSTLLSALAVKAIGSELVKVVYLSDQSSHPRFRRSARLAADWLQLNLEERTIEPALRKRGVYKTLGVHLTSLSGLINRILMFVYQVTFRETAFLSSLRKEQKGHNPKGWDFRSLIDQPEAGINARHRYRRDLLEDQAQLMNMQLIGAANRTEWMVGWFVKDGIDDLPIQPLKGLYKTQIRQLAQYLGVPPVILDQPPSPDMLPGITDELALGLTYDKIDLILDHLDGGVTLDDLYKAGCRPKDVRFVKDLIKNSQWKRSENSYIPPVDGTLKGGLRIRG